MFTTIKSTGFTFSFTEECHLALFAGRHEMPSVVTGHIFDEVDPSDLDGMAKQCSESMEGFPRNAALVMYVTGLTSATCTVIRWALSTCTPLVCMHYDRASGEYLSQCILSAQDAEEMRQGRW